MPKKPFLAIERLPDSMNMAERGYTIFRITQQSPKIRKALALDTSKFNCVIKGIEVFVWSCSSPALDTNADGSSRRKYINFYLRGSCRSANECNVYVQSSLFWLVEEIVDRINLLMFEPPKSGYAPTTKRELLEA